MIDFGSCKAAATAHAALEERYARARTLFFGAQPSNEACAPGVFVLLRSMKYVLLQSKIFFVLPKSPLLCCRLALLVLIFSLQ